MFDYSYSTCLKPLVNNKVTNDHYNFLWIEAPLFFEYNLLDKINLDYVTPCRYKNKSMQQVNTLRFI